MSGVVSRQACPNCGDSDWKKDNLVTFDNGSSYCFACGESGEKTMPESKSGEAIISGSYNNLKGRGISDKTCKYYTYQLGSYTGYLDQQRVVLEPVHIANYCDEYGKIVCQKLRASGKRMKVLGDTSKLDLYGAWLYNPNDRVSITITEGEIDCLSVAEVFDCQYPVVSVPSGAKGAEKYIKKNLEWLSKFKEVVLCFDMDDAGREATKVCAELFAPGKCKVCILPEKDANETLVKHGKLIFKRAFYSAKEYSPESIVAVTSLKDKIKQPKVGVAWPWKCLTDVTYGFQEGSIYTFGGGSGCGKTTFLTQITLDLALKQGQKVGAIFLEQTPQLTLLRLVGGMLGKRLHIPGTEWSSSKINECIQELEDKVYFYDHYGSSKIDSLIHKMRYMVKGLGCKFIVLDHLTALAADMKDERKGIDLAMARLGSLVQELDCVLLLVSHLAKPMDGKSYEQGRQVTSASFRGSQSIQYWSNFMVGIERNKASESKLERNTLLVRILKDRFSGEADGQVFSMCYNLSNGLLEE